MKFENIYRFVQMKTLKLKLFVTLICCSFHYIILGQTTIYVAPAPKTYYEKKRENAEQMLKYQMLLADEAERKLENTKAEVEEKRRYSMAKLEQIKKIYSSYEEYPDKIDNNWYNVIVTDNINFCDERKVLVYNGKVTQYVINNWQPRKVSFSNTIKKGKSIIKLIAPDGTESQYLDVYFMDYIIEPMSYTTKPQNPGTISFYATYNKAGVIKVFIDEYEVGQISHYFESGSPLCGQKGTLTIPIKPGTYAYRAENGRLTWKGSITVDENSCILKGFSK